MVKVLIFENVTNSGPIRMCSGIDTFSRVGTFTLNKYFYIK